MPPRSSWNLELRRGPSDGPRSETSPSSPCSRGSLGLRNSRWISPDEGFLVQPDRPSSTAIPQALRATSKKKKRRSTRKKLKAPDSDVEGRGETQNWAAYKIELTYNQRERISFLIENPVMKFMCPKMSNTPQGLVTAFAETSNKLEAVKVLMRTMKEADID
ncbi:Hypothetical protein PHPALM_11367 [Phytophthora palmivora]|uniref:Uncharacterized protein n=1 Tax=Phytophthora palmivora TaxID=4796 RepID=A0A2P4Y2F8_9STRA|nr:Hypothetical protein PHPALM_11367 [Phytophthora palmivora]